MNISSIGSGSNFGRLHRVLQNNQYLTEGQVKLYELINKALDDRPESDYNLLENLENIGGADVYVTFGDDNTVTLTARKRTPSIRTARKIEQNFYDIMSEKFNDVPMKATRAELNSNMLKIEGFCEACNNFVKKVIASGKYIS